ncbi:hypothetical protein [Enterobacter hormaechei]|uniref:hypothetical protein n=1 Tax=Enterobacter hormaechei TaxID=158836 RepID=UPI0015D4D1DB|nr:hypothetical protein [Enterobacter hormaechei]
MTHSDKKLTPEEEAVTRIENDPHFHDVFADIAGVTEYDIDGSHYVNLSFLTHRILPYADENGRPSSSRIDIRRVASVTLTREKAIALRDALNANLRTDEPHDVETGL